MKPIELKKISYGKSSFLPDLQNNQASSRNDICYEVATVKEGTVSRSITMCVGDDREKQVYISRGHIIELQIVNRRLLSSIGAFLIKYEGEKNVSISFFFFRNVGRKIGPQYTLVIGRNTVHY